MKQELEEFMKDKQIDSLDDMNLAMNQFVLKSWIDFAHYEISPIHKDAHKYLEKWYQNHHIKDLKKVLEIYPDCFLAKVYLLHEEDTYFFIREMEKMLVEEETRLRNSGIMKKYKNGFCFTLEGGDYLKAIFLLIEAYIQIGGYFKASKWAEKMLLLDPDDSLCVRMTLAGLYACLEEESKLVKLYRSRKEKYIPYDLSFMCLYYKRGDFDKAKEYLEVIEQKNAFFIPYVLENKEKEKPKGAKVGTENEVITVLTEMKYLIDSTYHIKDFIIKRGNV